MYIYRCIYIEVQYKFLNIVTVGYRETTELVNIVLHNKFVYNKKRYITPSPNLITLGKLLYDILLAIFMRYFAYPNLYFYYFSSSKSYIYFFNIASITNQTTVIPAKENQIQTDPKMLLNHKQQNLAHIPIFALRDILAGFRVSESPKD